MSEKKRMRETFDENWLFHHGEIPIKYAVKAGKTGGITDCGKEEDGEWLSIAFSDKGMSTADIPKDWSLIQLPHDWCVEGQYDNDPNLGTRPGSHGYLPVGIGFYRKFFEISTADLGKKISIQFDGVMGKSTVWVNGHLLGENFSGYTGTSYDVTDILRYGDEGKNVVLVKVDATEYEGWWYEGCGIYRHVWLEKTDRLHVARNGTYVTTPEIGDEAATVSVKTRVVNEYGEDKHAEIITAILGPSGEIVAQDVIQATIPWYGDAEVEQLLKVPSPVLWSPETPSLYQVRSEIRTVDGLADQYETTFGIRSIHFDLQDGFLLNGKPYPIKGTCNHQDFAGVGVALPNSLIEYKIKLLKEMGCNAYRSAHHPATPELLDICDRMGMLVMDENRKLDSSAQGIENLKELLLRGRNHPSIIIWSMENEENLEGTVMGARILKTLVDITHRIDPTRPTLAAMNHGWNNGGYSDVVDIVGYNYGQRRDQDRNDRKQYPNRLMIGSESASYTVTRGIYAEDPVKGHCSSYGTNLPSWSCSPEKAWSDVVENPYLTGVFIWTGFDYRGEPTPYRWPCVNSHFGIMDTCGFPKDIYYYMKAAWTEEPMVHAFPHWNWTGREGELIDVRVYSNCEAVELFLNGESLGEKPVNRLFHLEWQVSYSPGELKVVAKKQGEPAAWQSIHTTGCAHSIVMTPDRQTIQADGRDVSAIRVSVVDDQGRLVPLADNEITFTVEGGGRLLGVGNGNPSSHESDKDAHRRAFNGYCLALVQSGKEAGEITIKAESPGLQPGTLTISAR